MPEQLWAQTLIEQDAEVGYTGCPRSCRARAFALKASAQTEEYHPEAPVLTPEIQEQMLVDSAVSPSAVLLEMHVRVSRLI